jgi:hypothetical protein
MPTRRTKRTSRKSRRSSRPRRYASARSRASSPTVYKLGGHGVDVRLHSKYDPPIFWSARSNSYVVAADPRGEYKVKGKPVSLFSINGIGEVRWPVFRQEVEHALKMEREGKLKPDWDAYEYLAAARHYGLV